MDTVAFIPVRGGSRSIPKKNIREIAGRPLVHWTAQAALGCAAIERVFVASDSEEIRRVAGRLQDDRLSVIDRSPRTATDQATTESALLEFAERHEFARVVLIQATSPLLTSADLDAALAHMDERRADSLLSVTNEHRFVWREEEGGFVHPVNYDPLDRPRRQDWRGELFENGAFYVTSREALLQSGCRVSGRIAAWPMSPLTALELDEPEDWRRVELLLTEREQGGDLTARAQAVELVVSDVDGVLTDAGMYYGPDGELMKKFNTRDGMGLSIWRRHGFRVAIMTSEDSPIVRSRAEKLKIADVFCGVEDKAEALGDFISREGLDRRAVAYIGDDVNDLGVVDQVGLFACPADAASQIRARAHYVCERAGGRGCVRELIERLLLEKGLD